MATVPRGPDFEAVSHALDIVSVNVSRITHLPAVDNGNRVLEALQGVIRRLDDLQREQREGFARVERKFEDLARENTARLVPPLRPR
jgi:hypothetical protein